MCYNILGKHIKGELDTDWKLIRKPTVKNKEMIVSLIFKGNTFYIIQ